jgi:response regulator of citrate/malate metabolism
LTPTCPAGYKRVEELSRRRDTLEEHVEEVAKDIGSINPAVLEEDREIQRDIRKGYLDVDIGPLFVRKWVNFVNQHGNAVWQAKAEGWMTVSGDMVSGVDRDLIKEDNTLRIGDTVLMYMRKDQHLLLERQNEQRRLKQQYGIEAQIQEIADKNPKAFVVHGDLNTSPHAQTIQKRAAQRTAMRHIGNKMKRGTLPGVPIK